MNLEEKLIVEAKDEDNALTEAAKKLGLPKTYLQAEKVEENKFQINLFSNPGKMDFKVSENKLQVILSEMHPPQGAGRPVHSEWIRGLMELSRMKVNFGIDEKALETAIKRCLQSNSIVRNIVVASGLNPQKGEPAQVTFYFENQENKQNPDISKEIAMKGDILLSKTSPGGGILGRNVFNEPVPAEPGSDMPIQCGKNIETRTSTTGPPVTEYVSKIYGRIVFKNNKVDVFPPVRLSKDRMTATIDLAPFSCRGTKISLQEIKDSLALAQVSSGIQEKELSEAIQKAISTKAIYKDFVVAKGFPPQDGTHESLEVHVRKFFSPWKKKEAGLIQRGQIIGRISKGTKPVDGTDVTGKVLRGKNGREFRINLSKSVESVRETHLILKSKVSGYALMDSNSIEILPIGKISKDEMSVSFDFYPSKLDGTSIDAEFVRESLKEMDIKFGFLNDVIDQTISHVVKTGQEIRNVVVAKGQKETPGKDGYLEKLWEKSELKSDPYFVKKGEILGILHPPEKGTPGRSVFGVEIKTTDGSPYRIHCESGIEVVGQGDRNLLKALEWGEILHPGPDKISVDWDVDVSSDEMKAYGDICRKTCLGSKVELQDILDALKSRKVTTGYRVHAIQDFLNKEDQHSVSRHFLLAQGSEPTPGSDEHYEFHFNFNGLPKEKLLLADASDLKEIKFADIVDKGSRLVELIPSKPGLSGFTVYGEAIPPPSGKKIEELEIGENIRFDSATSSYISTLSPSGYVTFTNRKLEVFSPLSIAEDRFSASLNLYPPNLLENGSVGRKFEIEDLMEWLESLQIKSPADLGKFTDLLEALRETRIPILNEVIVRGFPPQNGYNEEINLLIETQRKAGKIRADGSIDLREQNTLVNVKAGDVLFSICKATEGSSGLDIFGRLVSASDGKKLNLSFGENIEKTETEKEWKIISKIDGSLILTDNFVSVVKTYVVDSDVNFKTGNIKNENGGVVIRGSVNPDFQVSASHDVVVEGLVDNAFIQSRERIIILGSALGERCEIRANGNIEVGIVNKAKVSSKAKINIRSESYHADLYSDDAISIESRSGRVGGGPLKAINKIIITDAGK